MRDHGRLAAAFATDLRQRADEPDALLVGLEARLGSVRACPVAARTGSRPKAISFPCKQEWPFDQYVRNGGQYHRHRKEDDKMKKNKYFPLSNICEN